MRRTPIIFVVTFLSIISHNVYSQFIDVPEVVTASVRGYWEPDPLCPYPSEDLTFFPYPYDCAKYYECYEGDKYVIECPEGKYFSTTSNQCDPKDTVDCDGRDVSTTESPDTTTTPTTTPTTTTLTTPTTTTEIPTTGSPTTQTTTVWTPDPLCPYPSDELTLYPNPDDCSLYFGCYEGERYLLLCPNGQNWSTETERCEPEDEVDCTGRGPSTTSSTISTETPVTNATEPTGPTTWTPDPLCPYPSEDLVFFPAPNCSQYYECYEGNKYLITCPGDLVFNDKTNLCDDRNNVDCDRTTTTTTPNTGPTEPSDDRCKGQVDGSFHANPNDCTKFYQCVNDKAIDEQCPADTYWNQDILTCDYEYDVNCNYSRR